MKYLPTIIKSFKHDGRLHRKWLENWAVPLERIHPSHRKESMIVLINDQTPIQEASGDEWVSKVPGVSFFIPKTWYNIVALIERQGIRYYCNIASPPYRYGGVLTYIDYDLDVILTADKEILVVDRDEYDKHRLLYQYPPEVTHRVNSALDELKQRMEDRRPPFRDEQIVNYYEAWKHEQTERT